MRALPVASLDEILGGARPLVLAPHADDESLGCGGLLAQAAASGLRPAVLVLTDGTGSHPGSRQYPPARLRALREAEAHEAAAMLGVDAERVEFLRLRDTAAPVAGEAFEAAVDAIAERARAWGCSVLLAPWQHDPHCDHEAAHLMAAAAVRREGWRHLAYPVWGWTLQADTALEHDDRRRNRRRSESCSHHALAEPATTGWRLDVARELPLKRRAIQAHRSQYAGLIEDDPGAFQLESGFLDLFNGQFETFLATAGY